MRHAKSDWDSSARSDFDRPLGPRGERDARRMGNWLLEQAFVPERIVSSPARRAAQTAEIVAEILNNTGITWHEELYLANLPELIEVLAHPPAVKWMLVGHNPGLEELVEFCAPDFARRSTFAKLMPTAGIYAVAIERGISAPVSGCGHVLAHERPKRLV